MSKEDVWEYLQEAMLPEVVSRQVQQSKPTSLENMLGVVADLVDEKHATLSLPKVRFYFDNNSLSNYLSPSRNVRDGLINTSSCIVFYMYNNPMGFHLTNFANRA